MMPWSGLSPASVEHANEMGTSELLHWTSIMLAAIALTTDRSMNPGRPQTRVKAKSDIGERNLSGLFTAVAAQWRCCGRHFSLDWNGPFTEVL
ncbi:hypothetical protein, partial [Martelella sp. HB161492]|uniref:hypothetical protein n=1 Tax=Martelella sp. HB161492 TaxID=2720726 RepID=UPI001AEE870D